MTVTIGTWSMPASVRARSAAWLSSGWTETITSGRYCVENVAQALAVERLAEAHDRAVAAAAVGGVVERAVDRRGKAEGRAVGRP